MVGKRQFKPCLFLLNVKFLICILTIYLSENPSSLPIILRLLFQIADLLFYIVNFKEVLRFFFWGFHIVSHDMLCDYVPFHSMYIEETLHKSDTSGYKKCRVGGLS